MIRERSESFQISEPVPKSRCVGCVEHWAISNVALMSEFDIEFGKRGFVKRQMKSNEIKIKSFQSSEPNLDTKSESKSESKSKSESESDFKPELVAKSDLEPGLEPGYDSEFNRNITRALQHDRSVAIKQMGEYRKEYLKICTVIREQLEQQTKTGYVDLVPIVQLMGTTTTTTTTTATATVPKPLSSSSLSSSSFINPTDVHDVSKKSDSESDTVKSADSNHAYLLNLSTKLTTATQYDIPFMCNRDGIMKLPKCGCGGQGYPEHMCDGLIYAFSMGQFDTTSFASNSTWGMCGYDASKDNGKPTRANLKYTRRTTLVVGGTTYDISVRFQFPFIGGKGGHVTADSTEFRGMLSLLLPDSFAHIYSHGYLLISKNEDIKSGGDGGDGYGNKSKSKCTFNGIYVPPPVQRHHVPMFVSSVFGLSNGESLQPPQLHLPFDSVVGLNQNTMVPAIVDVAPDCRIRQKKRGRPRKTDAEKEDSRKQREKMKECDDGDNKKEEQKSKQMRITNDDDNDDDGSFRSIKSFGTWY